MTTLTALWANEAVQVTAWAALKLALILGIMLGAVSYLIYAERKICGHIQARTGPNRVGPFGLLQPIADVGKLLLKEEFIPESANKVVFHIAPMLAVFPAIVTFSVIPMGPPPMFVVTDVNVGLLVFLAMSSLGVYAITLGGWASNNKYALLGGLRSSAQMISYELAMGLSTIPVILRAGSLSLNHIVDSQAGTYLIPGTHVPLPGWGIFHWYLVLPFAIFVITSFAETNRAPFDLPEAEGELVAGFHTEYSSMKWALFFLGEYMNMIVICSITVTLFLGGWHGPGPEILGIVWYLAKLGALLFFFIWVRWTFPRLRYDQLMAFGWKVLLPASIVNVLIAAVWIYWRANA
ncbi:MAG TPA: NADH-quinone oxidoreductase subunit NuoH [Candidatus Acidoferrales bacterium]|nr:NADH-quinone oxidoreductase subunit NuoH [Candidatus Acidoferrales bacterium]